MCKRERGEERKERRDFEGREGVDDDHNGESRWSGKILIAGD